MKFSIIIPVYNAEKTLEKCVNSILKQKDNNVDIQIILVENNSSDKSLDVCKQLISKDNSIELFPCEKQGVSAARNIGLSHVKGDIVGFCDADDYFEKDTFSLAQKYFKNDLDILVFGMNIKDINGNQIDERVYRKDRLLNSYQLIPLVLNDIRIMGSVCNKLYRREVVGNMIFRDDLSHCEDTFFNVEMLINEKYRCRIIDRALYNYVENDKSVTRNGDYLFDENNQLKYIRAFEKMKTDLPLSFYLRRQVGYAEASISANYLIDESIDEMKMQILCRNISRNLLDYLLVMWGYDWKFNLKKLIWFVKALVK